MKKLLIHTMLISLTTAMFSNCNVINSNNNINEINEVNTINEKNKSINDNLALMIFIDNWLTDDCLTNFQKDYRLKANNFKFLTYKDIVKAFEIFLHEKYDIKFKIKLRKEDNEYISTDKLQRIKIDVSLYKINENWKILNSNLTVNIKLNDTFKKLATLKKILENNGYVKFIENKKFNDVNEVVNHLNETFSKTNEWKDIEVELNETFITSPLYYCQNPEKTKLDFLANFVCLNLKINNYSMPVIITNLQTNFEIENLDQFKAFNNFNILLKNTMPHINLKHKLLNNGNIVTDYTYQGFVNYLTNEFIDYLFWNEDMQEGFPYIKINEDQNKIFTNGKNIVKLLITKNETFEQYIEYYLPVDWHEGIKQLPYNDFYFIEEDIFKTVHYPNNNIIESKDLKKGQPQKSAYNLILEKVKNKIIRITSLHQTISLSFIHPDKLLENDHNRISAKIKFADCEYPIDFHIKLTNT